MDFITYVPFVAGPAFRPEVGRWCCLEPNQVERWLAKRTEIVLDTETTGLEVISRKDRAFIVGLYDFHKSECAVVPLPDVRDREEFRLSLHKWSGTRDNSAIYGHNLRFDAHALGMPYYFSGAYDTMVAHYGTSTASLHGLDPLARIYRWPKKATLPELKAGKGPELLNTSGGRERLFLYLLDDLLFTAELVAKVRPASCFWEDMELEAALYRMERLGVEVNGGRLGELHNKVGMQARFTKEAIEGQYGFRGSLTSPKQIGDYLVSQGVQLPKSKKGNQWSTDSKTVLMPLADGGNPFVIDLLEWRRLYKLETAFLRPLNGARRVFPSIRSTSTATGRLSYASPNLQQIPARTELGKELRCCFATGGYVSVCDYSQIELRVAAALSGEPGLIEAYKKGEDVHEIVAKAASLPSRFAAKEINFGLLNNMGARRLAVSLKCSVEEARAYLNRYNYQFLELANWRRAVVEQAKRHGCAMTEAGRARMYGVDDNYSTAVSVRVQGTAAEIMRRAVLLAHQSGLEPILTVHDELVVRDNSKGEAGKELRGLMERAAQEVLPTAPFSFPVSLGHGVSWGDAK